MAALRLGALLLLLLVPLLAALDLSEEFAYEGQYELTDLVVFRDEIRQSCATTRLSISP